MSARQLSAAGCLLLGLLTVGCADPKPPRSLDLAIQGEDGKGVTSVHLWLATKDGHVAALSCPEGEPLPEIACITGGVKLLNLDNESRLTVKARGFTFVTSSVQQLQAGSSKRATLTLNSLPAVEETADYVTGFGAEQAALFSSLSVPSNGALGKASSLKFYIAELKEQPVVYFQNTRRFPMHYGFVHDVLLGAASPDAFAAATYQGEDRQAMAATVTHYPSLRLTTPAGESIDAPWALEFFPSDDLSPSLAQTAHRLVEERLGLAELSGAQERLVYVPAGEEQQSQTVKQAAEFAARGIAWARSSDLYAAVTQQLLNPGVAFGTLRLLTPEEFAKSVVSYRDILVLTRLPNDLPLVGGTITAEHQTPLAHVNLLAHARGTPNLALTGALTDPRVAPFLDQLVRFEVTSSGFSIAKATAAEAEAFWAARAPAPYTPELDLTLTGLPLFEELQFSDYLRVGSKAANLGELRQLLKEAAPKGFAIPFAAYQSHLSDNAVTSTGCDEALTACQDSGRDTSACQSARALCGLASDTASSLEEYLTQLLADAQFSQDSLLRDAALFGLRLLIETSPVPAALAQQLDARVAELFGDGKVKLRSSTNVEDLADFNGAGLYESYPATASGTERASLVVRRVWSSAWSFGAFEERAWWNVDQSRVAMGVAVNPAISDERAYGVVITGGVAPCSSGQSYVNVQLGEVSVTNPSAGAIAEAYCTVASTSGETQARILAYSTLSPDLALLSQSEVQALQALTAQIVLHFAPLYGTAPAQTHLDLEFKLYGPERTVLIKQVRPFVVK
jgi:pyruvate,water dikinase